MILLKDYNSPIGPMTLAAEGDALIGTWFDGQKYDRLLLRGQTYTYGDSNVLLESTNWLSQYFAGNSPTAIPKLQFHGSPFQCIIWNLLTEVPYGQAVTYGELAAKAAAIMGKEHMSAQAVGGAVGHNPISVIVPCHRILGANGSLTGYAGGLERKLHLLRLEGYHI